MKIVRKIRLLIEKGRRRPTPARPANRSEADAVAVGVAMRPGLQLQSHRTAALLQAGSRGPIRSPCHQRLLRICQTLSVLDHKRGCAHSREEQLAFLRAAFAGPVPTYPALGRNASCGKKRSFRRAWSHLPSKGRSARDEARLSTAPHGRGRGKSHEERPAHARLHCGAGGGNPAGDRRRGGHGDGGEAGAPGRGVYGV